MSELRYEFCVVAVVNDPSASSEVERRIGVMFSNQAKSLLFGSTLVALQYLGDRGYHIVGVSRSESAGDVIYMERSYYV